MAKTKKTFTFIGLKWLLYYINLMVTKMSWLQQTNIDDLVGFVISEFDCTLLYLAIDPFTNECVLFKTDTN